MSGGDFQNYHRRRNDNNSNSDHQISSQEAQDAWMRMMGGWQRDHLYGSSSSATTTTRNDEKKQRNAPAPAVAVEEHTSSSYFDSLIKIFGGGSSSIFDNKKKPSDDKNKNNRIILLGEDDDDDDDTNTAATKKHDNKGHHHQGGEIISSSATANVNKPSSDHRDNNHNNKQKKKHSKRGREQEQTTTTTTTTSAVNELSACLLIKDDNDLLNEWIAYHYHVVNMRYLVVAVDPSSETSPKRILDKWQNLTRLQIQLYTDQDFMPTDFLQRGYHIPPVNINSDASQSKWHEGHEDPQQVIADTMKINNHRFRQVTFLSYCFRHLRDLGKSYTFHVDTDEFMVINPLLRNTTQKNVEMLTIPSISEPASIPKLLEQIVHIPALRRRINHPCISMPRLLFGSVENNKNNSTDTTTTITNSSTTSSLLSPHYHLETLRWKYHTSYDDKDRNAQPKIIVDLQAVDETDRMFHDPFSIHRPSGGRVCRGMDEMDFRRLQRYPITVNHYTGSWERYSSKNDTRRSERAYNAKAHVDDGYDDWIIPWLGGFIRNVGKDIAQQLFQGYYNVDFDRVLMEQQQQEG